MGKPELLAPAGDWESMVAAVQNGADAVYLGGSNFSARQQAANFDREALARAVEYAHVRGAKIYVTVNTLIADHEMEEALDFLWFLYNTGVDAVIVQDTGLIRAARRALPELELHASTQMTVHSTTAAEMLRDAGLKRIVLAREMSLEEIKTVKARAGVEVEAFIHGALCICYSGQCLMSSMIGGRSGNRGRCAQPCRLQYRLENTGGRALSSKEETGEYLLSPRDLNLSEYMPDLIRSGIDSFKIEGRMKRPEYVATVIRIYRTLIDRTLAGSFYVTGEEKNDLLQIFNRDFTTGYFFGHPGKDLMSCKRPNNRGVLLGRIKNYSRQKELAEIKLELPVRVGDGLEVWVSRGGRMGTSVNRILSSGGKEVEFAGAGETVRLEMKGDMHPGDRVFKTHDSMLMEKARGTYTSERETRKIPVTFYARAAVGEPLKITVRDPEGFQGEWSSEAVGEPAQKRPLDREFLLKQLNRLGNTPYRLRELHCDIQDQVMVPVREINETRRQALEQLSRSRVEAKARERIPGNIFRQRLQKALNIPVALENEPDNPSLAVAVSEMASLHAAVWAGADEIYFGGDAFRSGKKITGSDIEDAAVFCREKGVKLMLSTPRVLHDNQCDTFLPLWEKALSIPVDGILVSNLGLLELARRQDKVPLVGDFPLNIFNRQSAAFFQERDISRVTLSPELTLTQIRTQMRKICLPCEVPVHGAVPLMVSRYCVLGGVSGGRGEKNTCTGPCKKHNIQLRDRKGITFPVRLDTFCNMHIFNSKELCMVDNLDDLLEAGIKVFRVDARLQDSATTEAIARVYREALDRLSRGTYDSAYGERAKRELEKYSRHGFTRGHYYRGVI